MASQILKTILITATGVLLCSGSMQGTSSKDDILPRRDYRTTYPGAFFCDGHVQVEPEEKEAFLSALRAIDSESGLYALFIDDMECTLTRAGKLELELYENECNGSYYGTVNSDGRGCSFLMGGMGSFAEREFYKLNMEFHDLMPENLEFTFSWVDYSIHLYGVYEQENYDQATDVVIELRDNTNNRSQIISSIDFLEYKVPMLYFIGDIDGDGKPDLIIDEGYNYELFGPVLYLSSFAEEGEIVKRMGEYRVWFDC